MAELRIELSDEARSDIFALKAYITERDGQGRADLVLGRIEGTIRALAFMPGMGRSRHYLAHGLRAFPSPPWQIVYRPLPSHDGILVVRVVDGRRDLKTLFRAKHRTRRPRKRQ